MAEQKTAVQIWGGVCELPLEMAAYLVEHQLAAYMGGNSPESEPEPEPKKKQNGRKKR